jgi:hypothetical protein
MRDFALFDQRHGGLQTASGISRQHFDPATSGPRLKRERPARRDAPLERFPLLREGVVEF